MTFVVSILLSYRGPDSNRHVLIGQQILSLSCLPISPPRRNRWVEGRTRTDTIMFCRHSPYSIRAPRHLSGIWESNPHLNLGRVVCYHCTNSARNDFIFCWLFLKFAICELRIVICTNTRTRTLIFGFGDRHSTIELWTCVLTRYKESNLE